ncbi:MAG: Mur ligase family protein [Halieaceae bacterium]|nr:Mur ligase family protein [Halieaceae bacterium]
MDSRRLTGAGLMLSAPGAVIDVSVSDEERDLLVAAWQRHVTRLLQEMDWPAVTAVRPYEGGVSLAIEAPVDGLYTATEINEAAFDAARDWLGGTQRHLLLRVARHLRNDFRDEERPRLQRLLDAAKAHGTLWLLDDEELTLGTGRYSQTWDLYQLPHPDDVRWSRLKAVPTALVTGTNGKTTTVRLLASIARAQGRVAGVSSTDWLAMGDDILSQDDYAGPAGARAVLRDQRCELAILETARGGLMRRGLAVARADVAVITNIAADHLGDYGIETVDDLAAVKWSVTRALDEKSRLVLNADDPLLMARKVTAQSPVTLFALSPSNPHFTAHVAAGGQGFTVQRGRIVKQQGKQVSPVISLKKIPVTYGGRARHNIANSLAAAAAASALRIPLGVIAEGLSALRNEDNPGRANLYEIRGATVLLDFAHNPAGLTALMPVIANLPAKRRLLVTGQAGDRGDADIREFALAIGDCVFDRIILKQMDGHARGRPLGEAAELMREAYISQGYKSRSIALVDTEMDAARAAARWAKPGDLIVFLAHENKARTREYFESLASKDKSS